MFDLVQITEDFVEVAAQFRECLLEDVSFRNDHDSVMGHRRPENLKDDVRNVLGEHEEWTIARICERLNLAWNKANQMSIGLILKELGWKSRVMTIKRLRVWRKSFDGYQGLRLAPPLEKRARTLLGKQSVWTTEMLCEAMRLEQTPRNKQAAGYVLKDAGWTKRGRRGYYVQAIA